MTSKITNSINFVMSMNESSCLDEQGEHLVANRWGQARFVVITPVGPPQGGKFSGGRWTSGQSGRENRHAHRHTFERGHVLDLAKQVHVAGHNAEFFVQLPNQSLLRALSCLGLSSG